MLEIYLGSCSTVRHVSETVRADIRGRIPASYYTKPRRTGKGKIDHHQDLIGLYLDVRNVAFGSKIPDK